MLKPPTGSNALKKGSRGKFARSVDSFAIVVRAPAGGVDVDVLIVVAQWPEIVRVISIKEI